MKRLIRFLKEARTELKKVTWPTAEDVRRSTVVVFLTVVIFTVFIFMADKAINILLVKVLG